VPQGGVIVFETRRPFVGTSGGSVLAIRITAR
jgi:hypothetical protein